MDRHKYILVDRVPVVEPDTLKWGRWFEDIDNRRVDLTAVENDEIVSTVFLGANHRFGEGEPLLFETLITGGKYDQHMFRYSTWGQARQGHERIVQALLDGDDLDNTDIDTESESG